ncbi:Protein kinase domain-containing protein [Entamoeba marina]
MQDLKPENILLRHNNKIKVVVADFGTAKIVRTDTTHCGTTAYGAPEVMFTKFIRKEYYNACDIWSLGVILYMLLAGHHPFDISNEAVLKEQMENGVISFEGSSWQLKSDKVKELIRKMLKICPIKRITIRRIHQHEWIKKQSLEYKDTLKRSSIAEAPPRKLQFPLPENDEQPKNENVTKIKNENPESD